MNALSKLPSVERLLQTDHAGDLVRKHGRPLTLDAIRLTLEELRSEIVSSPDSDAPELSTILSRTESHLSEWDRLSMRVVVNATGVILHTNLGRAPLSELSAQAMSAAALGYSDTELDLAGGKRGARTSNVEALLRKQLNAEAATVVNNNASAVLLVLSSLAYRKRVVISRSELVEIGGGFRIPDVMKQSGARLVEVGTTNKVRLSDYEEAFALGEGIVLHAHRSNFKIIGFTEEPPLAALAGVAHAAGRIFVDDLGSGALLDTAKYGLAHEPTVQESLAAGADIVCFSGDKLLGGPQAGVIVGRAELIQKVRKHPLARAVRADKTCLAALEATLLHYLRDEAEREIPVWRMISMTAEACRDRAQSWVDSLGTGTVLAAESTVGGGSLPGESLKTYVMALDAESPDRLLAKLRGSQPPVIARTESGRVLLDPRTVLAAQDEFLLASLRSALESGS